MSKKEEKSDGEPVTLSIDGFDYELVFTLEDIELIEQRLNCSIYDLYDRGVKGVKMCLYALIRGQRRLKSYDDVAALVKLDNYREIDVAIGNALLPALKAMLGSTEALTETDVGES